MTIKQSRYITAETEAQKKVRVTEVQKIEEDPYIRRSEVQQEINNSTLPVSSRAVNLAIVSINNDLDLKADKTELEGLATEDYVNEKIDEKEVGITEDELISKSVGSDKWMREGAYGWGGYSGAISISSVDDYIESSSSNKTAVVLTNKFITIDKKTLPAWVAGIRFCRNFAGHGGKLLMSDSGLFFGRNKIIEVYSEANAFQDKNGFLNVSKNPIDTLNTSDMADTVVDNDLLTVTSGAVFRAIKQLTDQIISLEARVKELEDGGV